ncbi:MAG: hypothetical protein DMG73_06560 [Acidobacteria bacterium]|nr:MAG: hypothetical protein DMG73_06560 [Acidobacteriota bacterium]
MNLFHPKQIDAVVCDYEMPGMSGGELAASIKRRSRKIPVILVSGCQSVIDTIPHMVDAAFPKGTPVAELVNRIECCWHRGGLSRRDFPGSYPWVLFWRAWLWEPS